MKFAAPLISGTLIKRYRRSLADVKLDNGSIVTAHSPSLGSMAGCSDPGRTVLLSDSGDTSRRHPLTWELIDVDGTWVGVNPGMARKIAREAIMDGAIPSLHNYEIQSEATYGKTRKIDLILQSMEQNCFINIHNVTWVQEGVALFPDAVSESPKKSLYELTEIAGQGHRAVAFFLVQRGDCEIFKPAEQIDRDYLKAILKAQSAGVEITVYRAAVTPHEITLGVPLPHSLE